MQIVYRYNLKSGKAPDYLDWLKKNDDVFRKEATPGWTYVGTWFTVRGLGNHGVESRWELDDYASLGSGFGTAGFQAVMDEWDDFVEVAGQEASLMKSEEDVSVA